jgi:hypothetical protein
MNENDISNKKKKIHSACENSGSEGEIVRKSLHCATTSASNQRRADRLAACSCDGRGNVLVAPALDMAVSRVERRFASLSNANTRPVLRIIALSWVESTSREREREREEERSRERRKRKTEREREKESALT